MNTERSPRSTFAKSNDIKFIQEFVYTKLYNPDFIEKLKLKQLKKFQLLKAKFYQENFQAKIQRLNQNLIKIKNSHNELKETVSIKNQESLKAEENIIKMEQKVQKLLNSVKFNQSQEKDFHNPLLKELKSSIEQINKNLENENQLFKNSIEGKRQKLSIGIQKKKKLSQPLINKKNELKEKKNQVSSIKNKFHEKNDLITSLKEKKLSIMQAIEFKVNFKELILRNTIMKVSQNTKAQELCIKKLTNFVKELNLIIDDPKSVFEQKKNMIDLLLNVYCPDKSLKEEAMSLSISPQKEKHDSIQTGVSLQSNYRLSGDENLNKKVQNEIRMPLLLLHSLDQIAKKWGLKEKSIDQQIKLAINVRKQSSDQKTEMKPRFLKIDRRDSLPSSLNQKDLHNQFLTYCENQIIELEATQRFLEQQEQKIEKQIKLLKQKCNQKDGEIQTIIAQNSRSFKIQ